MNLVELFRCVRFDQEFYIYIINSFDQNRLIGKGIRNHLLNELENEEILDHLLDEIYLITIAKDKSLLVRIQDNSFNESLEEQYEKEYTKKLDIKLPESRPYKFSCEMEDF